MYVSNEGVDEVTMKLKKLKLTDALLHKIYYETM